MLTDRAIKTAAARETMYRITDRDGLCLQVETTGRKLWRFRYRFQGAQKMISLGRYPDVSLADARDARDKARAIVRGGEDPSIVRKLVRTDTDAAFEKVARKWHANQTPTWTERHAADVLKSLEQDVFPVLGKLHVDSITPPMVLDVLRVIERRSAIETAHRTRQRISAVFVFAIASGLTKNDPAAIVKAALLPTPRGSRQPAITGLDDIRTMLADIAATSAHPVVHLAMRMLALTYVRSSELRLAQWDELTQTPDGQWIWTIPAGRMKMRREHLVPLSTQAVETLDLARRWRNPRSNLVFPSATDPRKPLSETTLNLLLKRAGYHGRHVPHGWRSSFSTVMNERHRADRGIIDAMLAHIEKEKTEAAYNRSEHMARRRELTQEWADLILLNARPLAEFVVVPRA